MPANLDIPAIRSIIAIADCGGYHRAADSLGVSQPTVSQHVRRLEKQLGQALLERDGRGMRFTPNGESLVARARPMLHALDEIVEHFSTEAEMTIVVGATEHAADQMLPFITRALEAELPNARIRFRLDRSSRLDAGLDQGSIDAAVMLGSAKPAADTGAVLPLTWYAAHDWQPPSPTEPLPLVVIDGPCVIRRKAIATLDAVGRSHRVVAESGYLAGMLNAVHAGVGVALLADAGPTPPGLRPLAHLPAVEPERLHVRSSATAPAELAGIVTQAVRAALV